MSPLPEKSVIEIRHNAPVPTLRWRHYELTAEQARAWAQELQGAALQAEVTWGYEEAARESKVDKNETF
jgi:hypothetical protein